MTDSCATSWIIEQLSNIPVQADVAVVLRHAEREDIHPGTFGVDVPLTACGVASAERLGAVLSAARPQIAATASPGAQVRIDRQGDTSRQCLARRGSLGLEARRSRPLRRR